MRTNLDGAPSDYTQPYSDSSFIGPFEYPLSNPAWVKNPIPPPDLSAGLPASAVPFFSRFNPFVLRVLLLLVILLFARQVGGYFIFFGGVWFWFQFMLIPCIKLIRRYYYDLSEVVAEASGPAATFVSFEAPVPVG